VEYQKNRTRKVPLNNAREKNWGKKHLVKSLGKAKKSCRVGRCPLWLIRQEVTDIKKSTIIQSELRGILEKIHSPKTNKGTTKGRRKHSHEQK